MITQCPRCSHTFVAKPFKNQSTPQQLPFHASKRDAEAIAGRRAAQVLDGLKLLLLPRDELSNRDGYVQGTGFLPSAPYEFPGTFFTPHAQNILRAIQQGTYSKVPVEWKCIAKVGGKALNFMRASAAEIGLAERTPHMLWIEVDPDTYETYVTTGNDTVRRVKATLGGEESLEINREMVNKSQGQLHFKPITWLTFACVKEIVR